MVSTAMQGGCTCENASCLRVETGNIEFAALFAPKPLGLTAADDWTKEMKTKGFPELQSLYALMGAPKNVELFSNTHFGHNYNYVSRCAFYNFVNKHFQLGLESPVVEEDYHRLTGKELTVWDAQHPQPPGGDDFERKLTRQWQDDAQQQLAALTPKDAASLAKWREVAGGGVAAILGRELPKAKDVELVKSEKADLGDYFRFAGVVRNKQHGEELPMAFLHPKKWNKQVVLWLSEQGKSAIFNSEGGPSPEAQRLMDAGISVAGIDLLFQGEFVSDGQPTTKNRTVNNNRQFAGYTYGYNHSLLAQRAHDVLTALAFIKYDDQKAEGMSVVALDGTGPIAAVAASRIEGPAVKFAIDTHGFRFLGVDDFMDANFLPGGSKYGDVPGFLSLATDAKLSLAGETADSAALVKSAYAAAGKSNDITLAGDKPNTSAVIDWLLRN
jgi:hypothetical protein